MKPFKAAMLLLCKLSDVAVGGAKRVARGRRPAIAVFNVDGVIHATDDRCTHGMALLSRGRIEHGRLICPLHFGGFDLSTGDAVTPPCDVRLRVHRVIVLDDGIYIDLEE